MLNAMELFNALHGGKDRSELADNALKFLNDLEHYPLPKVIPKESYVYLVALPQYLILLARDKILAKI